MKVSLAIALLLSSCAFHDETYSTVKAITEEEDAVTMRDAGASKERPRIEGYDMDADTAKAADEKKEGFSFAADVSRLMDIIINSLYTKKEVFIREIVSNASDALDKVRFISVQNPEYLGDHPDLEIRIDFDHDAKTVSITDTGVGMTKAELIKNLGTVAKSGTTAFLEAMGKGDSMSLIGQFGVGFYSAFLVANKVEVASKSYDDEQHIWTSTADAKFFVTKDPRGDTLGRGTRVTLYLKDDAAEYVEQEKIRNLVKKYSEFINYPIKLYLSKDVREQVPVEEEKKDEEKKDDESKDSEEKKDDESTEASEDKKETDDATKDAEVTDEEEKDPAAKKDEEPKTKTVTKQVWEWETINDIKAIWMREKADITSEEYQDFYKSISKDHNDPLSHTHFAAEGEIDFRAILYVPTEAPYDLFENYYGKSAALKLYVRRVLITEEFEELMPRYLNFIKGVVDSDDLPLNVSREQLQQMKMIKVMSKKLVRKALEMLRAMAEEEDDDEEDEYDGEEGAEGEKDEEGKAKKKEKAEKKEDEEAADKDKEGEQKEDNYAKFWKAFGKNIKLGIIEDSANRNKLAKLLRFHSTNDAEELTSLDEYISRMKPEQDTILYLPGDTKEAILKSPILKKYVKQGYEVLLLHDPIDEFCTQHLSEYEKRKVKSIAKDDVSLIDNNDELAKKKLQKLKEMYKPLTDWWKKYLGKDVEKVTVSNKLEDDPLFILTSQYGYSATMERVNRAQAFQNQDKASSYMLAKKTLEINPHHSVMKEMLQKLKDSVDEELDDSTKDMASLLYHMAMLNSGFSIDDPTAFAGQLQKVINVGFGLDRDQAVEEIEVDVQLDEEEKSAETPAGEEEEIKMSDLEVEDLGSSENEKPADETAASGEAEGKHEDL